MPFTSVMGAQSIIKPGVATSGTRPASPFNGQVLYETDTAKIVSWNGSAWVYTAASGLVLIKAQTIGSAVNSVPVTDVFSSTYENYLVTLNGGVGSVPSTLKMTLGATTAGYYYGVPLSTYAGVVTNAANSNVAFWNVGEGTTSALYISVNIQSPQLAKVSMFGGQYASARTDAYGGSVGGYLNNATQYTAFTITPASGTLTGGTIRVYGYQNS